MSTTDRPVIKAPEETIKYLQSDERERFFSAVKKQKKPAKRARDLALFELMYLYGLRLSEVPLLRLDELNWPAHQITIRRLKRRTKDGRPAIYAHAVAMSPQVEKLIHAWLKVRAGLPFAEVLQELFISGRGRELDEQTIWWTFKKYAKGAGLSNVHPHMLRHSCAIDLLKAGFGVRDIQDRLGHASVASTEIYTRLVGKDRERQDQRMNATLER